MAVQSWQKCLAATLVGLAHASLMKLDMVVEKLLERPLSLLRLSQVNDVLLRKPGCLDTIVTSDKDYIRDGGGFWDEKGFYHGPKGSGDTLYLPRLAYICSQAARGGGSTVEEIDVSVEDPSGKKIVGDRYKTFDEVTAFPEQMRKVLKKFPRPSQIQAYTWPLSLEGKDVIGIAATGSGKTLAFLLPAFAQMITSNFDPDDDGAGCLVLAPTRELAQQTEQEAEKFGKPLGLKVVAMYGGASKQDQYNKYVRGVHTIVACPGRLNDFLDTGEVQVGGVKQFVMDEADRMLDMGFEPQIRLILDKVPKSRHTMFFTATWPKEVKTLAEDILTEPYKVMIGNRDHLKGNQDITQVAQVIPADDKEKVTMDILRQAGAMEQRSDCKVLIFCGSRNHCEQLSKKLNEQQVPAFYLHGGKGQAERDQALNGLKNGEIKVLVATDVAARGLDIKGVGLVLNYDPPNYSEDYVHRIGRTGRAGSKGYAVTLLTDKDGRQSKNIIEIMGRTGQKISPDVRNLAGLPVDPNEKVMSRYAVVDEPELEPGKRAPPPKNQVDVIEEEDRRKRRAAEREKAEKFKAEKKRCKVCHRASCIC
eukprot:gnl/MRDRNA2_/MRDRNA2_74129_c0_seq1.p1 gnl/MRDRNA2_/MRDRNA2_74129_c0~~gnl/MRDRNA2_/MRDRNA2_74129_c0_seq1.p1  ORF type:complete len:609 (-),score=117.56 gnl/MRDRNA2_/MRDRNA2_74129_c0_seq1:278-2047(-)